MVVGAMEEKSRSDLRGDWRAPWEDLSVRFASAMDVYFIIFCAVQGAAHTTASEIVIFESRAGQADLDPRVGIVSDLRQIFPWCGGRS